jgi:hypothetical protein
MNQLHHRGLKNILLAPWSRVAATRDLPTIAFFRAGVLLRRSVPVPGILATHRPGAIMDKSGRQFVARYHFADDTIQPSTKTAVLPMS